MPLRNGLSWKILGQLFWFITSNRRKGGKKNYSILKLIINNQLKYFNWLFIIEELILVLNNYCLNDKK